MLETKRVYFYDSQCMWSNLGVYHHWATGIALMSQCCRKLSQNTLLAILQKHKMTYFGHTVRGRNLCTDILERRIDDGVRQRGRPRRKWTDDIRTGLVDQWQNAYDWLMTESNGETWFIIWSPEGTRRQQQRATGAASAKQKLLKDFNMIINLIT